MSDLSAQSIEERCQGANPLIYPFFDEAISEGRTYGLTGAGYDIRIRETLWLWPFWGRLASSIERFIIPNDLAAELKDKSTNARMFVTVQNTRFEPGWEGYPTIELTRHLPWPVRIKAGTPIGQVIFRLLDKPTNKPYCGKYQNQPSRPIQAIMA